MTAQSRANREARTPPPVRRGYFESRYGQIHVYNTMPHGGGFEEGTTLVCLHEVPLSGRTFHRVLGLLGRERSVYAPDLPGYGESDPPAARPSIEEYAALIGDFLDTMRLRQIDLLGCQVGALVAAEIALTRPQLVRRNVWISVPMLGAAEQAEFSRAAWPKAPSADGAHLQSDWRRLADDGKHTLTAEVSAQRLAALLSAGANASWGMHAALQYPAQQRLGRVAQPVLLVRAADAYWEPTARVRELLPKSRLIDFAEHGAALWETAPEAVADAVAAFLR
jgi:pimeloyl-ACP methyl ester carboxylesterase